MCPDPALLVAYLVQTLFSRDVVAIEQHVSQCEECTKLLADMRRHREAARSSVRWQYVGAAGQAFRCRHRRQAEATRTSGNQVQA